VSESPRLSQRLARLDQILAKLEREELDLDEALALFEEGVGHLREAEKLVRTAELRIERLLEQPRGTTSGEDVGEAP
jgi:exodeoxyribonuclease VII small subunit